MSKNIIIGVIALAFAAGIMLIIARTPYSPAPAGPAAVSGAAVEKDISGINALAADMTSFNQDDVVSGELDGALNEVGAISDAAVLNDEEQNLSNLSNYLTNISGDEAALKELDQALGEAAL